MHGNYKKFYAIIQPQSIIYDIMDDKFESFNHNPSYVISCMIGLLTFKIIILK